MGLPGLTKEQMIELDRLMVEDLHIPIELMMENAGLNLARLAIRSKSHNDHKYIIIAGVGNNGGGGLVAGRRLRNWNYDVVIYVPRGINSLRQLPRMQLTRAEMTGIPIIEGMPSLNEINEIDLIIDAYVGYGFNKRDDEISNVVFDFLSQHEAVISLDAPSGLDVTTGENAGGLKPLSTLTIAFVKKGLLRAYPEDTGTLFVCDIGVPNSIYKEALGIEWKTPFDVSSLNQLETAFSNGALQRIEVFKSVQSEKLYWEIQ